MLCQVRIGWRYFDQLLTRKQALLNIHVKKSAFDVILTSLPAAKPLLSAALLLRTYVKSTSIAKKLTKRRCGIKDKANTIKLANRVYILLLTINSHKIIYKLND